MVRYSFLVGLFHPLLHTGLSRRLPFLTVGHGFDEGALGFGDGAEFGEEFVDEGFEAGAGFGGEDDGLGEHAVSEVAG